MINYSELVNMNKAQLIDWIYRLSEEYIGTNFDNNSTDGGYNAGLKDGIEGFRRYLKSNLEQTKTRYKLLNFDEWKQHVVNYTREYIKTHKIFRHIPSDVSWDISGKIEEVKENVIDYVLSLEMDEIDENILSLLYNGNSEASYVSGFGFFYENYYDAIVKDMETELYARLSDLNGVDGEELDDELYDYMTNIEKE